MVQLEKRTRIEPPARRLTLIAAAPKADRLRWMVEKCTELGATSLMVAEFERSVVHVRADQSEKLRRYAIEACKQCGRAWLPEIECGLSALPAAESASGHRFVADLTPGAAPLSQALAACGDEAVVLVGPEGGLAPGEREALTGNQVQAVSLGANTLRTETAAIAIAAVWANLAQGG